LSLVEGPDRGPDPFADPLYVALVEVVAERGYEATEASEVISRAGISNSDFEARFGGWEDFVLAALGAFIDDFTAGVQSAYDARPDWRSALRAAAYAAADWMNDHPRTARFGGVEVLAAHDEMIRVRRERAFQYCAGLIDAGRAEAADAAAVPEAAAVMAIGAIAQILTQRMQRGEALETDRMVPAMMYQAVRPYLGEEVAREELTIAPPDRPGSSSDGDR
jgi:AcrR family transcriptional regulator